MTDTLTQLIARVQAALIDDGTRFTTATCTAAVREALKQFNLMAPIHAGTLVTVVADQKEYELSDEADAVTAIEITDILEQDDDGEYDRSLLYDPYNEDERLFFRLRVPLQSGTIIARFTIPHIISGLDSETESTLSALYDQVLVNGAAAEALSIRARSRVETINLQQGVSDNYIDQIKELRARFNADLAQIAARRRAAVGEPPDHAWNDSYHSWDQ